MDASHIRDTLELELAAAGTLERHRELHRLLERGT